MNLEHILSIFSIVSSFSLSIIAIIITVYLSKRERKSAQKRFNIELMEKYHGIEFYRDIRSVVWGIHVKWFNLPEDKRDNYRNEVVLGWIGYSAMSEKQLLNHEVPSKFLDINHHLTPIAKDSLSEHQILAIYLSFWVNLYKYFESKTISYDFISEWKEQYYYEQEFLKALGDAVKNKCETEANVPNWIIILGKLESIFKVNL